MGLIERRGMQECIWAYSVSPHRLGPMPLVRCQPDPRNRKHARFQRGRRFDGGSYDRRPLQPFPRA
jgi:hypothetical protein